MSIELVIFDCDGVLINSEAIYASRELAFLERAGLSVDRATYLREFIGLSFPCWRDKVQASLLEQTGGQLLEGSFQELRQQLDRALEKELTALPGARAQIEALGRRCCVASNSARDRLHWKLRRTNLLDLFGANVFSADLVTSGKPCPELFLHAAGCLEVDPAACVVVEDSVNGVRAGIAAGMRVIGFVGGGHCDKGHGAILEEHGAEKIVRDHEDLASVTEPCRRSSLRHSD